MITSDTVFAGTCLLEGREVGYLYGGGSCFHLMLERSMAHRLPITPETTDSTQAK